MKKIKKMKKLKLTNHEEYWEARAREIFEYVDRKDIDFFAELEKLTATRQ